MRLEKKPTRFFVNVYWYIRMPSKRNHTVPVLPMIKKHEKIKTKMKTKTRTRAKMKTKAGEHVRAATATRQISPHTKVRHLFCEPSKEETTWFPALVNFVRVAQRQFLRFNQGWFSDVLGSEFSEAAFPTCCFHLKS